MIEVIHLDDSNIVEYDFYKCIEMYENLSYSWKDKDTLVLDVSGRDKE